jgi:tRNA A37 threonylcarbamoyladenosine dehydratase
VGRLRIIDFDQVSLSSLNRHAVATLADVGTPKVACMRRRMEASVPWIEWESFNEVWREEQAERLLGPFGGPGGQQPDYVVDAIDNIDTKVALLMFCRSRAIPVVSSMGAGCKSDPTRVMVGDISATSDDPLSRTTRRRLKLAGVAEGITAVFSTEKPDPRKAQLLPLAEHEFERGSVGDLSVLPDFRARILPVIGTMPAVFGYTAANFLIMKVAGYPYEPGIGKARDKTYDTLLAALQAGEERLARLTGADPHGLRVAVTSSDVGYVLDEIFRGRSVVSGLATKLVLCRWTAPADGFAVDRSFKDQKVSRLKLQDLVCMTKEEAATHEKQVLLGGKRPEDVYGQDVLDRVAARLREERHYDQYR